MRTYGSLRGSGRFAELFSRGCRVRCGDITLVGRVREGDSAGVGLIVGRRVGNAVRRNRIRRRLRAALDTVGVPPGADYAVIAGSKTATVGFSQLCGWVKEGLEEIGEKMGHSEGQKMADSAPQPTEVGSPLAVLSRALIRVYQKTLSPILPSYCRFYPSCSRYAYTAIGRFGFFWGGLMGMRRIVRCNPFGKMGMDPVPERRGT